MAIWSAGRVGNVAGMGLSAQAVAAALELAEPLPSGRSWAKLAACRGRARLFFAPHGERPEARERREAEARAVCQTCPVLETCRAWARERGEFGFWGGESEEERADAGYTVAISSGRVALALDVNLTRLTEQAAYMSVPIEGPHKPDHNRYGQEGASACPSQTSTYPRL